MGHLEYWGGLIFRADEFAYSFNRGDHISGVRLDGGGEGGGSCIPCIGGVESSRTRNNYPQTCELPEMVLKAGVAQVLRASPAVSATGRA